MYHEINIVVSRLVKFPIPNYHENKTEFAGVGTVLGVFGVGGSPFGFILKETIMFMNFITSIFKQIAFMLSI